MERRRRRFPAWTLACLLLMNAAAWTAVQAKVYDRCELAMELHERFKFPKRDLDKCTRRHELALVLRAHAHS